MRIPEVIKKDFYQLYQSPNVCLMAKELLNFIKKEFSHMLNNQHVSYLTYTFTRLQNEFDPNDPTKELPVMVYGMISTAFQMALKDHERYIVENNPQEVVQVKTREEIIFLANAACRSMFFPKNGNLDILQIEDFIELVADVMFEKNAKVYRFQINMDLMASLLVLLKRAEVRKSLDPFKEAIKKEIGIYLEGTNDFSIHK